MLFNFPGRRLAQLSELSAKWHSANDMHTMEKHSPSLWGLSTPWEFIQGHRKLKFRRRLAVTIISMFYLGFKYLQIATGIFPRYKVKILLLKISSDQNQGQQETEHSS